MLCRWLRRRSAWLVRLGTAYRRQLEVRWMRDEWYLRRAQAILWHFDREGLVFPQMLGLQRQPHGSVWKD